MQYAPQLFSYIQLVVDEYQSPEMYKQRVNSGKENNIWFWRDNHGTEIDFLLEETDNVSAIEVKSGMNLHESSFKNLKLFQKYNPGIKKLYLIYNGEIERTRDGVEIMNWRNYMM